MQIYYSLCVFVCVNSMLKVTCLLTFRLVELYGRTKLLLDVLRFFTSNGFNWSNENTMRMYRDMTEHDRKVNSVIRLMSLIHEIKCTVQVNHR